MKNHTVFFRSNILVENTATIVGPKEAAGPLGAWFDKSFEDDALGQKTYEKAEIAMHTSLIKYLLNKTRLHEQDIDVCLCGDLLDEIISCNFTMRNFDIPFMGLYNACATFAEGLILAAFMLESGQVDRVICSVSSHFSTAERQYRYPLELGNQRTPLSQVTTTGAGATLLNKRFGKVAIDCATVGRVIDYGIKDANDMGAAMAPAARETLLAHFAATGRRPDDYDLILTGDLGKAGSELLRKLMEEKNVRLGGQYNDCGAMMFEGDPEKIGQGGSGPACSAAVFNSFVYKRMLNGELKRVLLVPTGALLSKISSLQGETIPAIAHAVSFTTDRKDAVLK
jgi:stage V sporulation protein AD